MRRVLIVVGLVSGSVLFAGPAEAGGGCHGGVPAGSGTSVELKMNCMNPRVLTVTDGETVTFVNRDAVKHNLVGDGWFVEELSTGETNTHKFAPGTHAYSCTLHPGMVGAVVVGDTAEGTPALAAVTTPADDGGSTAWVLAGLIGLALGSGITAAVRRARTD